MEGFESVLLVRRGVVEAAAVEEVVGCSVLRLLTLIVELDVLGFSSEGIESPLLWETTPEAHLFCWTAAN